MSVFAVRGLVLSTTSPRMDNAESGPSRRRPSSAAHSSDDGGEARREVAPILRLPPELFDSFLHHVPPQDLQSTALALSRVFPDHPISRLHLWRHIAARHPKQMRPMWRTMKEMKGKRKDGGPEATRTFSMVRSPEARQSRMEVVLILCRRLGRAMPIS